MFGIIILKGGISPIYCFVSFWCCIPFFAIIHIADQSNGWHTLYMINNLHGGDTMNVNSKRFQRKNHAYLRMYNDRRRLPKVGTRGTNMQKIATSKYCTASWQHTRGKFPLPCIWLVSVIGNKKNSIPFVRFLFGVHFFRIHFFSSSFVSLSIFLDTIQMGIEKVWN